MAPVALLNVPAGQGVGLMAAKEGEGVEDLLQITETIVLASVREGMAAL